MGKLPAALPFFLLDAWMNAGKRNRFLGGNIFSFLKEKSEKIEEIVIQYLKNIFLGFYNFFLKEIKMKLIRKNLKY